MFLLVKLLRHLTLCYWTCPETPQSNKAWQFNTSHQKPFVVHRLDFVHLSHPSRAQLNICFHIMPHRSGAAQNKVTRQCVHPLPSSSIPPRVQVWDVGDLVAILAYAEGIWNYISKAVCDPAFWLWEAIFIFPYWKVSILHGLIKHLLLSLAIDI